MMQLKRSAPLVMPLSTFPKLSAKPQTSSDDQIGAARAFLPYG
jgi:hypothetical protein